MNDDDLGYRYWTWPKLKGFLADNDLVISTGPDDEDAVAISPRGAELLHALMALAYMEAG